MGGAASDRWASDTRERLRMTSVMSDTYRVPLSKEAVDAVGGKVTIINRLVAIILED